MKLARVLMIAGCALFAVGVLTTLAGVIHTLGAVAAQGLSEYDRRLILFNGFFEASYNLAFMIVGAPLFFVGVVLGRQARSGEQDRTMAKVGRALTMVGLALIGLGAVGGELALFSTDFLADADGLSRSDRARILANGTMGALFNAAFGVITGGPIVLIGVALGHWGKGRHSR